MHDKDALKWFTVQDCLQRYPTLAAETELASWGGDSALQVLRLPQSLIPYTGRVRGRFHDLFFFIKGDEDGLLADTVLRFATVDPVTRGVIPGKFVHWEGMTIRIRFTPLKLIPPNLRATDVPALRRLGIDQAQFQRVFAEAIRVLDGRFEARISAA